MAKRSAAMPLGADAERDDPLEPRVSGQPSVSPYFLGNIRSHTRRARTRANTATKTNARRIKILSTMTTSETYLPFTLPARFAPCPKGPPGRTYLM